MESAWSLIDVTLPGRGAPRLDGVTVRIPRSATAVLGPSGSGKTSLLNVLVGFEIPAGTVDGPHVSQESAPSRSRLPVFWAPCNAGLWPHLTVEEHLTTVQPVAQDPGPLLKAFDLDSLRHTRPGELSQGERSRLNVARALASEAALLVLDEPLVHVDPACRTRYWDVIRAHCSRFGTGLVFSTHQPEVALREARELICLDRGRVTYAGPAQDLYDAPPSAELAALLGPFNWFTPAEQARWLGQALPDGQTGLRPERLEIAPCSEGPLEVSDQRFCGSITEVDVRDPSDGQTRTLVHRPQRARLQRGDRVLLRLLLLVLLMLGVSGCEGDGPALQVRAENYWSMPPDGPRVPAPRGIGVSPKGEYLVLDNAGRLLVFDDTGTLRRRWWMPEFSVGKPEGVCFLQDGRIAVADTHYHRIVLFSHDGDVVGTFGSRGSGPGEFMYPVSVIQDDQQFLYVCEYGNNNDRVQKFRPDGTHVAQIGSYGTGDGQFQRPSGAAWYDGRLYVVDAFNNRIQVFETDGTLVSILGGTDGSPLDLYYPYDIAVNGRGELFVVEYGAGRVTHLERTGRVLGRYGTAGSGPAQLLTPWGLTVDSRGRVYVCDTGNRRIVELEL